MVLEAAERYRKDLDARLSDELTPFLDERGRVEDAYRGAIRRTRSTNGSSAGPSASTPTGC